MPVVFCLVPRASRFGSCLWPLPRALTPCSVFLLRPWRTAWMHFTGVRTGHLFIFLQPQTWPVSSLCPGPPSQQEPLLFWPHCLAVSYFQTLESPAPTRLPHSGCRREMGGSPLHSHLMSLGGGPSQIRMGGHGDRTETPVVWRSAPSTMQVALLRACDRAPPVFPGCVTVSHLCRLPRTTPLPLPLRALLPVGSPVW